VHPPDGEVVVPLKNRGVAEYPLYRISASQQESWGEAESMDLQSKNRDGHIIVYEYGGALSAGEDGKAGEAGNAEKAGNAGKVGKAGKAAGLGETFHAVLLLAAGRGAVPQPYEVENIMSRYAVSGMLPSTELTGRAEAFLGWLEERWPNARYELETSGYSKRKGRLISARIDLLVETENESVIIDHKTIAETADPEKIAVRYAPQLRMYRSLVTAARPEKSVRTMIHLPLQGKVVEVLP
jgi:hypothetical protein